MLRSQNGRCLEAGLPQQKERHRDALERTREGSRRSGRGAASHEHKALRPNAYRAPCCLGVTYLCSRHLWAPTSGHQARCMDCSVQDTQADEPCTRLIRWMCTRAAAGLQGLRSPRRVGQYKCTHPHHSQISGPVQRLAGTHSLCAREVHSLARKAAQLVVAPGQHIQALLLGVDARAAQRAPVLVRLRQPHGGLQVLLDLARVCCAPQPLRVCIVMGVQRCCGCAVLPSRCACAL